MIITKLQGGLGNQMFQYAAAKAGTQSGYVFFDRSFLKRQPVSGTAFTARAYELYIFRNIKGKFLKAGTAGLFTSRHRVYSMLRRGLSIKCDHIIQTEKNEFVDLSGINKAHTYLDGYFQNERYFKNIRGQLLEDFNFPAMINTGAKQAVMSVVNPVSIHVRRGDYLKPAINAYHGLLSLSYYKKAMEVIEQTVSDPHYFIFSDDPEWCRDSFGFLGSRATVLSKRADPHWQDMYLMTLCKHNIIANSSYSWWAAWLNKNPDKIVTAPQKWFVDHDAQITPQEWIKL
ncbi:alpha-1,2-fucosyltransferase [Mucilaginibacter sabulilitoris]|uniref:Alpha-1,2-fucosyltransferase n=1 Tax=Mucilaginibacter sabulilitoris TaxID=1173583 RepID=A0ABZ0TEM2_9SPHI|nr:alpha-1,2-fucosyltransferase [Mucilaginibacter sabulilitoris]WPU91637.1 alpha-1,2-fucosyltransferase [Mucilaginibacter sabulilitoris]